MNDEELSFVRKHALIYDLPNPRYMDNSLKENIWREVNI
jgi:hypothetical protein